MTPSDNILLLAPEDSPLLGWLRDQNERVIQMSEKITLDFIAEHRIGFIISYGYRHIIKQEILIKFPNKAINLHISYLPWNRGADPNIWSFIEGTPKGVSIHYLDEGIDTGDIIFQAEVSFAPTEETLSTTYEKLHTEIQKLFKEKWSDIKSGNCPRNKQVGKGSYHKSKDKEILSHLLTQGWNTPVSALDDYAAELQMSMQFWDKYDIEINQLTKQKES